jgi:hypothetical protein
VEEECSINSESYAAMIGLVLAAVGLFYTGIQIRDTRKIARREFLLHIDEMIQLNDKTHLRFRPGGDWSDGKKGPLLLMNGQMLRSTWASLRE